jgi:hypothetical protein
MITRFIKNICEKITTTKQPKISPKNLHDVQFRNDSHTKEIVTHRYALINRGFQIGNLITYRTRVKIANITEQEELKNDSNPESSKNMKNLTIKVKVNVIKTNENQEILKKYNEMKHPNWSPLEILQRAEGGYQIEIPEKKNIKCENQNDKIKQLRWVDKALVCRGCYTAFNEKELQLLFRAMHSVLGDDVYLE